jgi:penicillin amidase
MRILLRWLRRFAVALAIVAIGAVVGVWLLLRASLPTLDGTLDSANLLAPVTIERDALGAPTVTGRTRADVAFGLGFVHAQDRYFQMDLARRLAAGELSEVFGAVALDQDRRAKLFRFRRVARDIVAAMTPAERAVVDAYVRGVNEGLGALRSRPWEYWLLQSIPRPWRDEDTMLAALSMWWQLQFGDFAAEARRSALTEALTARLGAERAATILGFLFPAGTAWDAPLDDSEAFAVAATPGAEVWDLRAAPKAAPVAHARARLEEVRVPAPDVARGIGSNNWAVAGAHTATGAALVANDMHLGLDVPPVWYRARLRTEDGEYDLAGVTLAGAPLLVAGSNGHIAWGFTNSYGNWLDLTWMPCADALLTTERTRIRVKGAEPERFEIERGPFGVVFASREVDGARECQLATWLAMQSESSNLGLLALERASSVAEALDLAPAMGMPHQNLVVGDAGGHIGWTIAGRIPAARDAGRWAGGAFTDPATHPRVMDPASGRLWSANARAVGGDAALAIAGDEAATGSGYDLGARAGQIRDDLRALVQPATPADMLAIQLDDRALFLAPWREWLLALLVEDGPAASADRAAFRELIAAPMPRASVDSVAYALVRTAKYAIEERLWSGILAAAGLAPDAFPAPAQFSAVAWQLVTEQPAHWLAAGHTEWRAFLLEGVDAAIAELKEICGELAKCAWGRARPVAIRHPLSGALPFAARWLDMRVPELAGDHDMPRVQGREFGASQRFGVSPSREAEGYLEVAGGVSGHPLSPFYRAGFEDWAQGAPTPFLPGPAQHKLVVE